MEEIIALLNAICPLSPACIEYLYVVAKFRKVKKNEIILPFGQVNRHLYFIKKGGLYCYYMVKDKPVSNWFFWENETVVSIGSFYLQVPSKECIVALERSELYSITKEQYDYACRTFPEFGEIARLLLQKYLVLFNDHPQLIRMYETDERYQLVLEKYPEMAKRVPVRLLATWLAMEPETLSRKRRGK